MSVFVLFLFQVFYIYIRVWKKVSDLFSLFYIMYDLKKNVYSVILAEDNILICCGFYL